MSKPKFKFRIRQLVVVVDRGESYTTYIDFFKENHISSTGYKCKYNNSPLNGKTYKIIAKGIHSDITLKIYVIKNKETKQIYLIGEKGIKDLKQLK